MKHPLALALAVALTSVAVTACKPSAEKPAATETAVKQEANPFFAESTLPLQYPHFDKIKDSHFAPAFEPAGRIRAQALGAQRCHPPGPQAVRAHQGAA
jgi:peptidyl-dipeptidase Dcp